LSRLLQHSLDAFQFRELHLDEMIVAPRPFRTGRVPTSERRSVVARSRVRLSSTRMQRAPTIAPV
jgi:hypothetical protein